ncbi:unnamed protein product [Adineta ricciae]|uniref:Transcriptional regulator ATRX-like protein n=1 Tax=Adineta ricciae TaxID=249248 RepID=A0A816DEE6_ADIRI|nr:unnamed protein product [Adineta ricciae]
MTTNLHQILNWLKVFKTVWLLEQIPENTQLHELIVAKLTELEDIVKDDEEYHRAKLLDDHSSSDNEEVSFHSTLGLENTALTQSEHENDEQRARQALLEESEDSDDHQQQDDNVFRPSIRLKRISQEDAHLYMPLAWRNDTRKRQSDISENSHNDANTSADISRSTSKNHGENSKKRKARMSDNDAMDSPSKTRKPDETSASSSTSDDDDDEDYNIKFRTRRKSVSNKTNKTSNESNRPRRNSTRNKDVIINYNLSSDDDQMLSDNSVESREDSNPMELEDKTVENDRQEPAMPSSSKKAVKTKDTATKDPSDDVNEPPLSSESESEPAHEQSPVDVPSYSHLLNRSKSFSSSSESTDESDTTKKPSTASKPSKRVLPLSSTSDISPVKKKTKYVVKHRANLSISTSDSDSTSSAHENAASVTRRLRIKRSSSEESVISDKVLGESSSERRKQASVSKKQVKRKRDKKRSSNSSAVSDGTGTDRSKSKQNETDDDEEKSPSKRKHGRKNIRKIMDDQELDAQTKNAIEAEKERRKRIAEKQKEYNESLLEQSSFHSNNEVDSNKDRLILERDKTTNEPLIEVAPALVEQLKPHQCEGVQFLWNNVFESIEAIQKKKHQGNGCILAHCMGLGKTLQIISFLHTVFNYDRITNVKTCLVLCPINAALNWSNEFDHWLKNIDPPIDHYQLATIKTNLRICHLNYWFENGGVMIMGYEMYRRLANGFGIKNKKSKTDALKCLVDPGPDIVVADEGHILKNAQTALAKSLSKIKTRRRIVLTGTPLQNNLIEYYCMVSFIKPNLLGSQSEYINRFVNPIQNGQHRDSNDEDVRLMKRRACVLHGLLTGFVDRKDYSLLKEYLPPKFEYIINIRLSDLQSELYEIYLKEHVNREQRSTVSKKDFKSAQLFADYQFLQKIWTHPFLLYPHFIDRWKKRMNAADDDDSFVDDNDLEVMFGDEEDSDRRKQQKSDKNPNQSELDKSYSGFLIDNIDDEIKPITSDIDKPPLSNSSTTTTINSTSADSCDETRAKEGNANSTSDTSDTDIEIVRSYPTRSRATTTDEQKNRSARADDSNVFDTENGQVQVEESSPIDDAPWADEMREQFWFSILDGIPEEHRFDLELSGKFLILKFILNKCFEIGDKVLLFSRSIYTLNHIEKFLKHLQVENEKEYQKQCDSRRQLHELLASSENHETISNEPIPPPVEWIRDQDYFRMDGQTEVTARKRYAKAFNNAQNSRGRLFLISTLAGGIGINLTGSNRVIVFDASWNPR